VSNGRAIFSERQEGADSAVTLVLRSKSASNCKGRVVVYGPGCWVRAQRWRAQQAVVKALRSGTAKFLSQTRQQSQRDLQSRSGGRTLAVTESKMNTGAEES